MYIYMCVYTYTYTYFRIIIIIIIVLFSYLYTIHNTECIVRSWMSIRLLLYRYSFIHINMYIKECVKRRSKSKASV